MRRGYAIIIDSVVALTFALILVTSMIGLRQGSSSYSETAARRLHYVSEDAFEVLDKTGVLVALLRRLDIPVAPVLVAQGQIKAGRVLALAVSTAARSPLFPNVPTVAEAGLPGFDYDQWYGLLVSAKTPRAVVNAVNREVVRILSLPEMKERMLTQGATSKPTTPEEFDAFIRAEVKKFAPVIIAAGARVN